MIDRLVAFSEYFNLFLLLVLKRFIGMILLLWPTECINRFTLPEIATTKSGKKIQKCNNLKESENEENQNLEEGVCTW